MSVLPEFIGTVHVILGPYRGNPIGLYLLQKGDTCQIAPNMYPWNRIIGTGETTNKAAADFEARWKESGLAEEMYTGPHWEGGIKPEKPKPPPKPAPPPKPPQSGDGPTNKGDAGFSQSNKVAVASQDPGQSGSSSTDLPTPLNPEEPDSPSTTT